MKIRIIVSIVLVLALFLVGCSKVPEPVGNEATTEPAPAPVPVVLPNVDDPVQVYFDFVKARRTKPIDWADLSMVYKSIEAYIQKTDEQFEKQFAPTILAALDKGLNGESPHTNAQIAEKTIQQALIFRFYDALKNLETKPDAIMNVVTASITGRVVRAAAARRDGWLEQGTTFVDSFDAALKQLKNAAAKKQFPAVKQAAATLTSLTNKVLVLSVFYELEGLEKARGGNAKVAEEKLVEAQIYQQNFAATQAARDKAGADLTVEQLAGKPAKVNVKAVRTALFSAFSKELAGIDKKRLGLAGK
jgi:hypothetical protein